MYFTAPRGNRVFYETYGNRASPPLLLIHGSTITGRQDYAIDSNLALRAAKNFYVIVPDCPGHGRSDAVWLAEPAAGYTHPALAADTLACPLEYSFATMAQDLAALLLKLEATPAFVMGHSNGGNVALYLVARHAAQVRGALLLAANGYIDAHLPASVPVKMHPKRVEREREDWMREMIVLHDAHHGPGFWRQLLHATIRETITNPHWTKADLAQVQVPCLCVQGGDDSVNVPGRHAETLAKWLPRGQLWSPVGIGHSVHVETPDEFEPRMTQFFLS
jgi:pimeloyl-ACP methyl ester carboxylesterase